MTWTLNQIEVSDIQYLHLLAPLNNTFWEVLFLHCFLFYHKTQQKLEDTMFRIHCLAKGSLEIEISEYSGYTLPVVVVSRLISEPGLSGLSPDVSSDLDKWISYSTAAPRLPTDVRFCLRIFCLGFDLFFHAMHINQSVETIHRLFALLKEIV